MKIVLAVVRKMAGGYLSKGIEEYTSRLKHYVPFEIQYIADAKNTKSLTVDQQFTSMEFSRYIERKMSTVQRRLVFVVGGPYGFSPEVYARASEKISLSSMTFSHEMIRLIFTEQLYRAMTILRGEPYHHE